jgi:lipopolysaccharide export system permease protein
MKANGISLYRISAPIFLSAVGISFFLFFFSEWITPLANQKADFIKYVGIKKEQPRGTFKQSQIWYRGTDSIYNFHLYDSKTGMIEGVSLYFMTDDFRPRLQISAEKALWEKNHWIGHNVQVITLSPGGLPTIEKKGRMVLPVKETPADFEAVQTSPDKMGFFELKNYIDKLVEAGADVTAYLADLHAKIAFAFVTVILTAIGIIFSVHAERSGGIARSIGLGMIIGFSYWIVHAFAVSLGRAGTIPPAAAAWTANGIFLIVAASLSQRIRT